MGVGNPSYFITTKNKKNMKNAIIVPFDLNTARKIKSGEIEGSVLIKDCRYATARGYARRAER